MLKWFIMERVRGCALMVNRGVTIFCFEPLLLKEKGGGSGRGVFEPFIYNLSISVCASVFYVWGEGGGYVVGEQYF